VRFGPLTGQKIDENRVITGDGDLDRESTHSFRKRLGIRRSIDLSGQAIEVYSRPSIGGASTVSDLHNDNAQVYDYDEPDELKAEVVIELILRVADVGHNLQSWENMTSWMSRMFKELLKAHEAGRGYDPRVAWFDNQIQIFEYYLLPLASRLEETGVFVDQSGPSFVDLLEGNLDRWMLDGISCTESFQGK